MLQTDPRPGDNDICRQQGTTEGVEPPQLQPCPKQREQDREEIENDIGDGVGCEGLHGGIAHGAAPEEAESFDHDSAKHDCDGAGGEANDSVGGRSDEVLEGG